MYLEFNHCKDHFFTILKLIFQKKFSNKSITNCAEIVRFRTVLHFRQSTHVYPQDVNISEFEFQFLKNRFAIVPKMRMGTLSCTHHKKKMILRIWNKAKKGPNHEPPQNVVNIIFQPRF